MSRLYRVREASRALFSEDFRATPYWLDDLPAAPEIPLVGPASAEVVIIGSGYTGLNAALQTARGGRDTVVLDALPPGAGCSTRNGGQISTSVKPSLEQLARRYGKERALAIRAEGKIALEWIESFIESENIQCDFRRVGRFHAAHSARHYEPLVKDAERLSREEGIEAHAVARRDQHHELGTDFYHGGVVFPSHAALHPARYHRGLLDRALAAGAQVVAPCAAQAVTRDGRGFRVFTGKGTIAARDVVVATNGYTTSLTPWLRRRIIPIGSYVIATEPLAAATMARLFPSDRIASDTRRVVYYYRASPDRRRVLFGGRVSANETDPMVSAPLLHAEMCRIFPELAAARISHSWTGTVAYSFDELAHSGVQDGIYYAMCYCGSGVSMASYLGMRLGQQLLGKAEGRTAFAGLPFPTRPLYTGSPWFLPAVVSWYRWCDRF